MNKDLAILEEALDYFIESHSQPKSWEAILQAAEVSIDRSAARVLTYLCESKTEHRLSDLAAKLDLEAPSITRIIQRLERAGLVIRLVDDNDRRSACIKPSIRGTRLIARLRKAKQEQLRGLMHNWPELQRKQLITLLRRLARDSADFFNSKTYSK